MSRLPGVPTASSSSPLRALSFVSAPPTRVLAQIELFTNHGQYENKVYVLPKHLDQKVAALHLDKLGVKLTPLTAAQANYLNLPLPAFKPEHYRYWNPSRLSVRDQLNRHSRESGNLRCVNRFCIPGSPLRYGREG